jgi:hypothetical protein
MKKTVIGLIAALLVAATAGTVGAVFAVRAASRDDTRQSDHHGHRHHHGHGHRPAAA